MTFAAWVRCDCYERGLASPPPYPVVVTDEGDLDLADTVLDDGAWDSIQTWILTACTHPEMSLCQVTLANNHWWYLFLEVIEAAGRRTCATLIEELPACNQGGTPPERCAAMLGELDAFARSPTQWPVTVVRDGRSGRVVARRPQLLASSAQRRVHLEDDASIVVTDRTGKVLLRGHRLRQQVVRRTAHGITVRFIDPASGGRAGGAIPVAGGEDSSGANLPAELVGEVGTESANDWRGVVDRLGTVLSAAVAHNRPVLWT